MLFYVTFEGLFPLCLCKDTAFFWYIPYVFCSFSDYYLCFLLTLLAFHALPFRPLQLPLCLSCAAVPSAHLPPALMRCRAVRSSASRTHALPCRPLQMALACGLAPPSRARPPSRLALPPPEYSWAYQLGLTAGHDCWALPLGSSAGLFRWAFPLGFSLGLFRWAFPLDFPPPPRFARRRRGMSSSRVASVFTSSGCELATGSTIFWTTPFLATTEILATTVILTATTFSTAVCELFAIAFSLIFSSISSAHYPLIIRSLSAAVLLIVNSLSVHCQFRDFSLYLVNFQSILVKLHRAYSNKNPYLCSIKQGNSSPLYCELHFSLISL